MYKNFLKFQRDIICKSTIIYTIFKVLKNYLIIAVRHFRAEHFARFSITIS